MSLKKKEKKKTNVSKKKGDEEKEKEKEIFDTYLETRAWFEGYMAKVFKARCPQPTGWESPTLLLVTWVNRWSLAICRCWSIELINSPR